MPDAAEIIPDYCPVCGYEVTRNFILMKGMSRCTKCHRRVHYLCLDGKGFWKRKPRVCKFCAKQEARRQEAGPA